VPGWTAQQSSPIVALTGYRPSVTKDAMHRKRRLGRHLPQAATGHVSSRHLDGAATVIRMTSPTQESRRALVLHDRPLVVDLIELTLNHGLFVVRAARSLVEAEAILVEWRPDMTVVDMDHDDSSALLQRLGTSNTLRRSATPVLGLTRRGDLKTKLRAFDLGVDDILTMPFSPEELLARSIVITRRAGGVDRPIVPTIMLGEMEIDIVNRQVRAGASVVHLSGIEQSLLYLLASRAGKVVTRDDILDAIWGTDFVAESNIVDRHVRSLRIKLQNDYRHPRFIATVRGEGYRFVPTFTNTGWAGERADNQAEAD
jgi:two-component system, OmpR family, alkaline phosphatase synthesis response regulator PhoP